MVTSLFTGAGQLRLDYETVDWSTTSLGPVSEWDQTLITALRTVLATRFPATLLWGPDLVLLYNEAYLPLIAEKHPAALGAPAQDVFPEVWDDIGPLLHGVLNGGPAVWQHDAHLPLRRRGRLEDSWFTFCYSPVYADTAGAVGRADATDAANTAGVGNAAGEGNAAGVVEAAGGVEAAGSAAVAPRSPVPQIKGPVAGVLDVATETTGQVLDRRRTTALGQLALALVDVLDVNALAAVVADQGLAALGCDGGAVAVLDPGEPGVLLSRVSSSFGEQTQRDFGRLPLDADLPVCVVARTGQAVLLADEAAARSHDASMNDVVDFTGCCAFACLPMRAAGKVLGVLTAGWKNEQTFDAEQLAVLEAFAAQCAQSLLRMQTLQAERAAAAEVAQMAHSLQASLLTSPPEPDHLDIAVRYTPATTSAEVGGDWYDAFISADGVTHLVIGDVTGHDRNAAAAMGQLRNLLRGITYPGTASPASVLKTLDAAARDLRVDTTATLLLARIEQIATHPSTGRLSTGRPPARQHHAGQRVLRWSNAGHLPPLLICADGTTSYLDPASDLLLGVDVTIARHDHEVVLEAGCSVLLYTDGLIERRGAPLQEGLDWLAGAVEQLAQASMHLGRGLDVEELCEALLGEVGRGLQDDVALLAVKNSW